MKKKYALTLIEMLIAILVFSIGILAVLRVITGNISVMDYTNRKLQSTILAKEGIELLYNVRDSNLEKKLPRNCIMNPSIYDFSSEEVSDLINYSSESAICADYFGTSKLLQLSFDKDYYITQATLQKTSDFDILFENNKLCLYHDTDKNLSRYSYCKNKDGGEETIFARYLSFAGIQTSEPQLPTLPEVKILKVESHVLFKKLGRTGDVVFESFIGNY